MTKLDIENFDGAVQTKHGTMTPDGRTYPQIVGVVSILEGKTALGFDVKDDSNWFARIESADGKRSVNIPGCQVQSILQGDFGTPAASGVLAL